MQIWHAWWDLSASHLFFQGNKFYTPLEKKLLSRTPFFNLQRKTIGSTSEGSTKASIAFDNPSTRMVTKSMTKAAASITLKQQAVAPTLQSCKTQNFGLDLPADGVNQTACLPNLKLKILAVFNIKKALPCGLEKFQTYIYHVFQPICEDNDDYGSRDSSPTSSRDSVFSQVKVESFDTIIMPFTVTETINLEG